MSKDRVFVSWHFDTASKSVIGYALTEWFFSSERSRCELVKTETGKLPISSLIDKVSEYAVEGFVVCHLIDNRLETKLLYDMLATVEHLQGDERLRQVEVDQSLQIRAMNARRLLSTKDFYVPSDRMVEPDLIFSDIPVENIIDPMVWDEAEFYPLSEALSTGLSGLEPLLPGLTLVYDFRSIPSRSSHLRGYGSDFGRSSGRINFTGW